MERPLPWSWQVVLTWGGLRGALSLAMALSLPLAEAGSPFPHRDQILAMTFGVILFTLLVQGLTLQPLLKRLGLVREDAARREYERTQAQVRAIRAAVAALEREARGGGLLASTADRLRAEYVQREKELLAHLDEVHLSDHAIRDQQLRAGHRQLLTVEKGTLRQLYTEGAIDEETWRSLSADVDRRQANLDSDEKPASVSVAPAGEET
jgi:CPA1 family monovalent cation:H+ antiporter